MTLPPSSCMSGSTCEQASIVRVVVGCLAVPGLFWKVPFEQQIRDEERPDDNVRTLEM